jgi:hypothetical protein
MRKCKRCDKELTEENTYVGWKRKPRFCKVCWALEDKDRRVNNPLVSVLYRIRKNAKKRNLECSLTVADLPPIPKHCPVFSWIRLSYQVGVKRWFGSPSLDRINNDLGYVKGNVRWISDRANSLKSDASDKELIYLGRDANKRKKIENKA